MVNKIEKIFLSTFSKILTTRKLGRKIRTEYIDFNFEKNNIIIFDFEDIELITHSFSDECFGKLVYQYDFNDLKRKTSFINYDENIEKTIIYVLNHNLRLKYFEKNAKH